MFQAMTDVAGEDMDENDEDCRKETRVRKRMFQLGLGLLIFLVSVAMLSVIMSVSWVILARSTPAPVYKDSAEFSVVVNAATLGVCYSLFFFIIIPTFWRLYKSDEYPNLCTRFFYFITLIFLSIFSMGTFVAGYVQLLGLDDPFKRLPDTLNGTNVNFKILLIVRSVTVSLNFFTALCSFILLLILYFIISQNPWRRCKTNGHCVLSCTVFNVLFMAVAILFLLTLEARSFAKGLTALRFSGGFLGVLCIAGMVGGLFMTICRDIKCISVVRLLWFLVIGAGCIALGGLLIRFQSSDDFVIIYLSSFIVGAVSILFSCCTCCYCYFNVKHGGRFKYVTRYSFACFRTGKLLVLQ